MLSAKEIQDKYFTMLVHDKNIKQILDDVTEALYSSTVENDIPYIHVRYDTITAKKVAFALRWLGYYIEEHRHGKLHIFLQEGVKEWD